MKLFRIILLPVFFSLQSCDPDIAITYDIINKTDDELHIQIFALRNEYAEIIQKFDTTLSVGEKINIHSFTSLGSGYTNPSDTITIFDSIHVAKKNMMAKSDFAKFETWDYTENKGRYGGGHFVYRLKIENADF